MKTVLGAVIGAFVYTLLQNVYYGKYAQNSDIASWLYLAVPTGIILGALTGYVFSPLNGTGRVAKGLICILPALVVGATHLFYFRIALSIDGLKDALAAFGIGLIWSILMIVVGIWFMWGRDKGTTKP